MFVTLQQDMDPLNNYTTTRGSWSPVAGSFNFLGTENKYVCHIIYIIYIIYILGMCCNMAVASKSLWLFYLFCQLFFQTYKV